MIVTVTPNPSVDRTYLIGALVPGTLHRAQAVHVEASGKGVNVSRILTALGTPTEAVVTSGRAEGRQLVSLLADGGIPVTSVPVTGSTRTNVTIMVPGSEPTKINEPGTLMSAAEQDALVAALATRLAADTASWLVCSGSLPNGTTPALIGELIAAGRAAGARTAVDSSGAALNAAVRAGADLLKPNAAELAELTGRAVRDPAQAAFAGAEVASRTNGVVLVSMGEQGAVLATAERCWHACAPPIKPVNTTGAGDALLAGLLATLGGADEHSTSAPATTTTPVDAGLSPDTVVAAFARAVAIGTSACLVPATAELPAEFVDSASVVVRTIDPGDPGDRRDAPQCRAGGVGMTPDARPSPSTQ